MIRSTYKKLEALARRRGYEVSWDPPALVNDPTARLELQLEHIIAHLMLTKRDLFFVEVGANDGVSNDPLYKFIVEFGWAGILLEPVPYVFEQLEKNYAGNSRVRLINAALSETDGKRTIYTVKMDGVSFSKAHQFSSFSRKALLRQTEWVPDIKDRIVESEIDCISFKTLLSLAGGRTVDILSTDTEGYDLAILKMIDFATIAPEIISFEHVHLSKAEQQEAALMLLRHGYRLTRDNLDTTAYRPARTFGFR